VNISNSFTEMDFNRFLNGGNNIGEMIILSIIPSKT
jgi:hypothetical protein